MKTPLILSAMTAIALIAYGIWYAGGGNLRERILQNDIDTTKEIRDAQNACPDSLPWFERLQCLNAK